MTVSDAHTACIEKQTQVSPPPQCSTYTKATIMDNISWHEVPDLTRAVIQLLSSSTDVLACDRVCKEWRALRVPLPSQLRLRKLDVRSKPQMAWLAYNKGRATSIHLEIVVPAQDRSDNFEMALGSAFEQLTFLKILKVTQASRAVVWMPIAWFMPPSIGQLTALQHLDLSCPSLHSISHECFKGLGALQELTISDCNMPTLPDSIKFLTALTSLSISKCPKLLRLPKTTGRLPSLQQLRVAHCDSLEALSTSLGDLDGTLRVLSVKGCINLFEWPPGMAQLHQLQELCLSGCSFVLDETLEQLTSLTSFNLDSTAWEAFPNIAQLHSLQQLVIANVGLGDLSEPPVGLHNLTELQLDTVSIMLTLPDSISCLNKLETLVVKDCTDMAVLSDTGSLCQVTTLTSITLTGCPALQLGATVLDNFGKLTNLREVLISGCTKSHLRLPPKLEGLSRLTKLIIKNCDGLATLPYSMGQLSALLELEVTGCKALTNLPMLQLGALQQLKISSCSSITGLGELQQLPQLRELEVSCCKSLYDLPAAIGNLTSLTKLKITGCGKLLRLPHSMAALAPLLKDVEIHSCGWSNLRMVPSNNVLAILSALEQKVTRGSPERRSSYSPGRYSPGRYSPGRYSPGRYSPGHAHSCYSPTRMSRMYGDGRDVFGPQMPDAGASLAGGSDEYCDVFSEPMSPSALAEAVGAMLIADPDDVWYPPPPSSASQDDSVAIGAAAAAGPLPPPPPPPPHPRPIDLAVVTAAAMGDGVRSPNSPRSPCATSSNMLSHATT